MQCFINYLLMIGHNSAHLSKTDCQERQEIRKRKTTRAWLAAIENTRDKEDPLARKQSPPLYYSIG